MGYEYKVVPAPARGVKERGVKGAEARFALAVERQMNRLAEDGWEYQRTDTLPSDERSGLTSTTTQFRSLMVFRRIRQDTLDAFEPQLLERPAPPTEAEAEAPAEPEPKAAPPTPTANGEDDAKGGAESAARRMMARARQSLGRED
ncbi:hypothetical protein SAMN04490248_10439 [Salinihabitans flavidus]|uniref:DUF4177 domain-containing protein n=1 Tax=Salinihabitans flavidus TaxID=569882 RepID=A0A1H8NWJ9_9RHOB|nr:hypothetical protein [Salinihabitans flavidus]SEO34029.1 hypothetical protein SAMN04490248_10439 [Salinihabitans flavidus]